MAGRFEVYHDGTSVDRFRLSSRSDQVIASCAAHPTVNACLNGIASIRENGPDGRTA